MKVSKDINFLPDYVLAKQVKAKKEAVLFFHIVMFGMLVVGMYLAPKAAYQYYQTKTSKLATQIDNLHIKSKVDRYETLEARVKSQNEILDKINKEQIKVTGIMGEIYNAKPSNVDIKSYTINGKDINIIFKVNSPTDIVSTMASLEGMTSPKSGKRFEQIKVSSLPITDGEGTVNFVLKLK